MEQRYSRGIRIGLFVLVAAAFAATATVMIIAILSDPSAATSSPDGGSEGLVVADENEIGEGGLLGDVGAEGDFASPTDGLPELQEASSNLEAVATPIPIEPTPIPTPTPAPPQVIYIDYVVQAGDSLYSVSSLLNSSIELLAINNIDAGDLVAGSVISVPVANPAFCPGSRAYVVREGDTIYGIALTLNSTADAIFTANHFPPGYLIKAAEVICVPY